MAKPYIFATPLVEGVIERRKSQFTMLVNYKGEVYSCHCPNKINYSKILKWFFQNDITPSFCILPSSFDKAVLSRLR